MKKMKKYQLVLVSLLSLLIYSCSEITNVNIETTSKTGVKGKNLQLKAIVKSKGNIDTTVTWSIVGQKSNETLIEKSGLLKIAENESADSITVEVISVVNSTKKASISIIPIVNKELFYGKWVTKDKDILVINEKSYDWKFAPKVNPKSVTFSDIKWSPIKIKEKYWEEKGFIDGYSLSGVANGYNSTLNCMEGQPFEYSFYINKDKNEIFDGGQIYLKKDK